jgi:hypothetical protein
MNKTKQKELFFKTGKIVSNTEINLKGSKLKEELEQWFELQMVQIENHESYGHVLPVAHICHILERAKLEQMTMVP